MTDRATATPTRAPVTPSVDLPMSVAVEELTGFEILAIERHYRLKLDEMGAIMLSIGAVWAYETRAAGKPASWAAVEAKTVRELTGYFAPEPADPDSELGKESTPAA